MALSMRMKTKVLPAYREHNMHDGNIVCASEFKNWDKMSINGPYVASGGLRVKRPRLKF